MSQGQTVSDELVPVSEDNPRRVAMIEAGVTNAPPAVVQALDNYRLEPGSKVR